MAHEKDRRASVRSSTARNAMFVAIDGSTLLQAGLVTDLSRDGLNLITRQPPPVGTIIELEIEARDGDSDSQPIIVRGRVVHVNEIGDGEYTVGVKLRYRQPFARVVRATSSEISRKPSKPGRKRVAAPVCRWWPFGAGGGLLLILIFAVLLWPRSAREANARDAEVSPGSALAVKQSEKKSVIVPAPSLLSETDSNLLPLPPSPVPLPGHNSRSAEADELEKSRSESQMDRVEEVRPATVKTVDQDLRAALALLKRARDSKHEDKQKSNDEIAKLIRAVEPVLKEREMSPEGAVYRGAGIHILVDWRALLLTVYRDGKPFTQYPVAIDEGAAIPTGLFFITNKVRDTQEDFGSLEVSRDGEPASLMIGAVENVRDSVEGQIGVAPEHGEALFRLCPVGASVTVR